MLDTLFIQSAENMFRYVNYYIGTFGMLHAILRLSEPGNLVVVMKRLNFHIQFVHMDSRTVCDYFAFCSGPRLTCCEPLL
jgi:hypothetical protein